MSVDEFKAAEKTPLTVVLDDVRSMYNVGSVLRSCDAFRVKEVLLCGITAAPPHPEIFVMVPHKYNLSVQKQKRPDNLLVKGTLQPHLEKHHRHGKGNAGNRHGKALALSGELKPRQRNSQRNNPFV